MGIEENFRDVVLRSLRSLVAASRLPAEVAAATFSVERPKRPEHGDVATSAALALAKVARVQPRALAELLKGAIEADPSVRSVEIAGPGFLNVRLKHEAYQAVLAEVHGAGAGYGRAPAATGQRVLLEFVSANPTGPLLVSHARGALVGDAIGRVLEANGHLVSREYYVNDHGNQVRTFARSVLCAAYDRPPPPDGYPGGYVTALARSLKASASELLERLNPLILASKPIEVEVEGASDKKPATELPDPRDQAQEQALAELSRLCVARMLDGVPGEPELGGIKSTLRALRVHHDTWASEEALHRWGRVQAALDQLWARGYLRELPDGALVFQMPEGEGDKDEEHLGTSGGGRVVRKNDRKTTTYFAGDIAYHADKVARGYDRIIDVLGADHHGYVPRVRNVMAALGLPRDRFEVVLIQLVALLRNGKPYKMGKRLGNLITADEVIEEIDEGLGPGGGTDALRYFYLSRHQTTPVSLDIELAKKASVDNPAIYLQYGHARLCSLLRKAHALGLDVPALDQADLGKLTHPLELSMIQRLGTFPQVVRDAGRDLTATGIVAFLQALAEDFNGYWTQTFQARDTVLPQKSLVAEEGWQARWDMEKTRARLFLVDQLRRVYASGLGLLGINAPERLVRVEAAGGAAGGAASDEAGDEATGKA